MFHNHCKLPSRRVEIFENERFVPLSGWSAKSLLLTDRKALSNNDGSDGYTSLEDANTALLSKGWMWDADDWAVDSSLADIDEEGWSYRTDFSGFSSAAAVNSDAGAPSRRQSMDSSAATADLSVSSDSTSPAPSSGGVAQKGLLHFARRRKLVRLQFFDANEILPPTVNKEAFTCDHCDLEEVQRLAGYFEEKLAAASLKKHPRLINERKFNVLKSEFVTFILSLNAKEIMGEILREVVSEKATENTSSTTVTAYRMDVIDDLFSKLFLTAQGSVLSFASSLLKGGSSEQSLADRLQELRQSCNYGTREEMEEFARVFIRLFDDHHVFHCSSQRCADSCLFRVLQCEHEPCLVCFSYVHKQKHENVCPEKFLPCGRACGVQSRRKLLAEHMAEQCILRPVHCPFHGFGCHVDLLAKDLDEHLDRSATPHMLLALRRMQEYEKVMSQLHGRVHHLEQESALHKKEIVGLTAAIAASTAALAVAEKKLEHNIAETNKKTEKKCISHADSIANELRTENTRMNRSLTDLHKVVGPKK